MIKTPAHYQRRARRKLLRLAFYTVFGSVAGGLLYLAAGLYLPMFL
ncbi:hypothetical protein SAMN05216198_0115 [Halopseudomonas litoralis]|uniref:Uncharacterized protein n=1 Tax=Halopseudomonas litoralis TaxID=797277 RepID=A0A1H1L8J9_9GAMM|nr:hypothetical protein [Halopseudomonas litoralis]SDR70209.1 hypothetical protein SAMN05216198_0115 [Halopseudomonas litoralis]